LGQGLYKPVLYLLFCQTFYDILVAFIPWDLECEKQTINNIVTVTLV
jgi:hypothetical protein